jgi:hypothetical protein
MTSRAAVGRYWPPEIGGSSARALPALKITFGMDGSFVSVRGSSMSQLKRALSFRIENRGPAGISQGSVVIESANCAPELSFPIVLKDNIALAAGADIFVPLVKYGEPRYPGEATGDSFAQLLLSDPVALFDINEQAVLKLKATGFDTPPYKAQCRIWVSNGRLQIQNEWRHD